jgi:[acyl-carrier-protein] S-malonyltransferase
MWQDSMERMILDGYRLFVEVGPGKSLSGLMRKISPSVSIYQVEDAKTLEKALKAFAEEEGA